MEQKTDYSELNNNNELETDQPRVEEPVQHDVCQICGYVSYHKSDSHPLIHMTFILPYYYIGAKNNAYNRYELKYFDIKTIINVAWEIQKVCTDEFKYIKYDWDDIFCFDILVDIDDIVDQIHDEIIKENAVLIHCAQGVSRSASVVIGYLMKYEKMNFDDAYKHVKSLRSCINPNSGFVDQLKKYSKSLSSTNATDK